MLKTAECTTTDSRPDLAFVNDKVYGKVNLENTNTRYLYTKRGEPQFKGGELFTEEVPVMAREQIERTDVDVYVSEVPVKVVEANTRNILPSSPFLSQQYVPTQSHAVDVEPVSVGSYRSVAGEQKCVEYVSPTEKIFTKARFAAANSKPDMHGKRVKLYRKREASGRSRGRHVDEEVTSPRCKTDCLRCSKSENEFHCDLMRYETDADECRKMCKKHHEDEEEVVVGEILYPDSDDDSCSGDQSEEIVISEEEEQEDDLYAGKALGKKTTYKILKPKSRTLKRKTVLRPVKKRYALKKVRIQ